MFSIVSSISSVITKRTGIVIEQCPDPGAGDLLWYKFDNTNGVDGVTGKLKNYAGTITDLSGALINAPTLNSKGTNQTSGFGSVTLGPGATVTSGKYIRAPLTIPIGATRTTGWTISCWLKIPSSAGQLSRLDVNGRDVSVFCFNESNDTSWGTGTDNSFYYGILRNTDTTTAIVSNSTSILTNTTYGKFYDDQWHLHTVTLNTNNLITFYFDAVKLGSLTSPITMMDNYSFINNFGYLPWAQYANDGVCALQYADIRIYKSVIPESQIRGLYRDTANNHP